MHIIKVHRLMAYRVLPTRATQVALGVTCSIALLNVGHARAQVPSGSAWHLSAEPLFAVGRADGPPETLFTRIVGALRLDDGRFVVADGEELRISVYNTAGRLQSVFGRQGSGPGEFRSIGGIWSIGPDTIGVWDESLQRITRFLPDGNVVRTAKPSFGPMGPPVQDGTLDAFLGVFRNGGIALAWLAAPRPVPGRLLPDQMVLGLFEPDGTFRKLMGRSTGMVRVYKPGVGGGPFAFSPFPWAAVVGDTLVFTTGFAGEIAIYPGEANSEAAARTLRMSGRAVSLREAWQELDAVLDESAVPGPMTALARSSDRSVGQVPHFARMFADDRGHLWLKEYQPSKDAMPVRRSRYVSGGRWRIVDMAGTAIAHMTLPANIAPIAVHGDLMLGISRDALDVEQFAVYRIVR